MGVTPKYSAKAVFFDSTKRVVIDRNEIDIYRSKGKLKLPEHITRFDSQHEFRVYLELCRMYGQGKVSRQFPVKIFPPGYCYPKGKNWKVDFYIDRDSSRFGSSVFVEAKGAFLPEFAHTLANLELIDHRAFRRLIIVFSRSIPIENKVIKALLNSDYGQNLLTLKELEQLTHLPLPL
jgi:hypothetical protein